jgi:predicted transporter
MADLVFAVVAFIVGLAGLPGQYFLVVLIAAVLVWAWTRRTQLESMSLRQRAVNGFIAFLVIGIVLLVAFEIGQFLGGHT